MPATDATFDFLRSIRFVGRCHSGTSDKIWGYLHHPQLGDVTFWGRTSGPWTFKRVASYGSGGRSASEKAWEKRDRGYDDCDLRKLGIAKNLVEAFTAAMIFEDFHQR